MAPEVAALAARGDLEAAAGLAESRGEFGDAALLWERACAYSAASRAALAAGNAGQAVWYAARVGDRALEAEALAALAGAPDACRAVALRLSAAGQNASAGRALANAGLHSEAAREFERASLPKEAAFSHEACGSPREAARCLAAALELDASRHDLRLALGALLTRHGRTEESVRTLQRIGAGAPEHSNATQLLCAAFDRLGMPEAARALLQQEGGGVSAPPSPRAAPAAAPLPARPETPRLYGRYQVVCEVARTPTARVLRASDELTGEAVALKLFSPDSVAGAGRDALRRFEKEARVLGQLRHPAIVTLRDFLPEGPALVLEWMPGGSLADELEAGHISPARAVEIARAVLSALAEAHRRGILHRDVKPSNVLFDAAGAPKLADFGTAHVSDAAVTITRGVIGTLAYMAPEQRAGAPATPGSDIYGAGALLWHALTGAPPEERLPLLSQELTAQHHALVTQLVDETGRRPASAAAAAALLASCAWPSAVPPARRASPPRSSRPAPRERLVQREGARHVDQLLGRELLLLPARPDVLERVRPWARVSHPCLPAVLCHRRDSGMVWVEELGGDPAGALDACARRELAEALSMLHAAGGWHGRVDRVHVRARHGRVCWRFPLDPAWTSPAEDRAALEAL